MKNGTCDDTSITKGKAAENAVAEYMQKLGYKIETRNFHIHMTGEIDLIASMKNTMLFVEVKYRSNKRTYDIPDGCVSRKKLEKIRKCADIYLQKNNITDKYCKFIGALVHGLDDNFVPQIKLINFE